ncbi:MAG: response regulator [Pseudanabaenaceae cyanobacterium SKYGB_i_bin29]|nr:response regulator [Pseudanabaenaceae cyanobacterium SKYG29]MDW8421274.1 response regulator [Pseudanabaenaceae cyanobacterium SKYGB_i_bin29]
MGKHKVLIVEDERLVARDIALALEEANYEIVGILSYGNEVIEKVPQLKPDLVLLDIKIAGPIDGIQVAEYLYRYWQTAVVFLTANSDQETIERAKKASPYGFLIKPFQDRQLLTAVEFAIENHQRHQERLEHLRRNITTALPHELNTALNSILGLSEIIITEFTNLERTEILEFVTDIRNSAQRLHFFTQRYLFFTQLELLLSRPDRLQILTKMEPTLHPAAQIELVVQELNREQQREFSLELFDQQLSIPLEFFTKLIKELIDNALRYSIPHTPIAIVTALENSYYRLLVRNEAAKFELDSIADSGAYVLSSSVFHDYHGSGLGLAIVHRILRLVEGIINFNFTPPHVEAIVQLPAIPNALQLD